MSASFPTFGFPSERPTPPSEAMARVVFLVRLNAVLVGAFLSSAVLSCILVGAVLWRADIEPYVADGGVTGCKVPLATTNRGGA